MQRFFGGGDPTVWMEIPLGVFRVYAESLPALESAETLQQLQMFIAASGNMKNSEYSTYTKELVSRANGGRRPKSRKLRPGEINSLPIKKV